MILLNCSMKNKDGNSTFFLSQIDEYIINIKDIINSIDDFIELLIKEDVLVLGVPLYVDALPSQVIYLFEEIKKSNVNLSHLNVYCITNLGFYESKQTHHLVEVIIHFCKKMNMKYNGGISIGAGPMVRIVYDVDFLISDIKKGLSQLKQCIRYKQSMNHLYLTPTRIPRRIYMLCAHYYFRKDMKKK